MIHHLPLIIFIELSIFSILLPSATPISFKFPAFYPNTTNISYEGDATPSAGSIQLNRGDFLCRVGHATFSQPIHLWDPTTQIFSDFTTNFTFTIDTLNSSNYGAGLTFFIAPLDFHIPPNTAGGFLGLFNTTMVDVDHGDKKEDNDNNNQRNSIVAVAFDSFSNPEWDPPGEHVGVLVNSLKPATYVSWNASLHSGDVGRAWVSYNASAKLLSLSLDYEEIKGSNNYKLSYGVDLMKILPEWAKIGFSGATGTFQELNIVHSWEFSSSL